MTARRKFILLGSSGECLPVSRHPASRYSSCHSSNDGDYFSARSSISDNREFLLVLENNKILFITSSGSETKN